MVDTSICFTYRLRRAGNHFSEFVSFACRHSNVTQNKSYDFGNGNFMPPSLIDLADIVIWLSVCIHPVFFFASFNMFKKYFDNYV